MCYNKFPIFLQVYNINVFFRWIELKLSMGDLQIGNFMKINNISLTWTIPQNLIIKFDQLQRWRWTSYDFYEFEGRIVVDL